MGEGFIKLPRSLFSDHNFQSLTSEAQSLFFLILHLVCWKPQKFNDFGQEIELLPGQVCISIRKLQDLGPKGMTRWAVEEGIRKLIKINFLRQETRHLRNVLTITHPEICNYYKEDDQTVFQTLPRQFPDTKEEDKKINIKKKSPKGDKEKKPDEPQVFLIEFCPDVEEKFRPKITQQQLDKLKSKFPNLNFDTMAVKMGLFCALNNKPYPNWYYAFHKWALDPRNSEQNVPVQKQEKKSFVDNFDGTTTLNQKPKILKG